MFVKSSPLISFLVFVWAGSFWLSAQRPELPEQLEGPLLVGELGCAACHDGAGDFKRGPRLSQVGSRLQARYLREYIARPHFKKPGTTMPDLLADYSEQEKDEIAGAIVDYLLSEQEETLPLQVIEAEEAERGEKLYHAVGCVACHDPEGKTLSGSSPLIGLDEKYSVKSLSEFLEDPLKVRPSGRMPDMRLTHWEAVDLAHYLLKGQKLFEPSEKETSVSVKIEEGRSYFQNLGCAQCHEQDAPRTFGKEFASLSLEKSCSQAHYDLSEMEQKKIASLASERGDLVTADSITLKMAQLNCYACHARNELGGVAPERDSYFTTSNLNLGEQARIPPHLDGVGAKLKPAALRRILTADGSVRPYMNTRMPRFGSANVESLIDWLGKSDREKPLKISRNEDRQGVMKVGHELVGEKGLACNSCHTFFNETSTTLNGLDLTAMWERLEEDWFHRYLRNPQQFHATTIMPSFWPNGKSVRANILEGDADKQIDAIWQYLSKGQEARRPAGVRREPIAYGPGGDEAVMLRRQYTGVGKRGIGVGYPAGIHLIFDAGKMSLGSIWKGDFAEMSAVWRGQGSGFVKEAGEGLVRFPSGPAFAKLTAIDATWPEVPEGENAPGFQFLGYSLDQKQRPKFRYQFEGLVMEDYFTDEEEGPHLRREISFENTIPEGFYFRVARGKGFEALDDSGCFWKLSNGFCCSTSQPVKVVKVGEEEELRLSLQGLTELVLVYHYLEL